MKRNQLIPAIIAAFIIIAAAFMLISDLNSSNDSESEIINTPSPEKTAAVIQTTESTPAFHGFHMVLINVSESTVWMYPSNSTIEELVSEGYKEINVTDKTFEDYPFIKEILKPKYRTTKALTDEKEKEIFFEKFYGVTFRYKDHNYVIDGFKN
ncbi:hypothetical protein L1994_10650 [Methanomicrobium antiquum]|uniref:Uncharacterized protein n=1 Tax=Methanomicrobium antiquum TaxID=487686 RepID=A0AAF0FQ38_9EURY|nr:hypothetical protein [Methanomicrobium antiquum]WFN36584.1 hypothetical protein L1994_10650 [Methanomicrobium antiquum]